MRERLSIKSKQGAEHRITRKACFAD